MKIAPVLPLGGWKTGNLLCYAVAFGVYLSFLGTVATTILIKGHGSGSQLYSVPVIVQLPRESAAEDIDKLVSSLDRIVGVADVSKLSERELRDFVEPWLSEEVLTELASFPILLEITKDVRGNLDKNKLLAAVQEIPGGVLINLPVGEQERGIGFFLKHGIIHFSLLGLLLLFLSMVVLLVTQMSVFLNRELVSVLQLLGATESFLVQEFRLNMLRLAVIGGAIGSMAALGTVFILVAINGLGINVLLLPRLTFLLLFLVMIGLCAGPILTWLLAPIIIGRELSLLKKPRW